MLKNMELTPAGLSDQQIEESVTKLVKDAQ